ncbi:ROK family protein [Algirhabdus cladophorae]|uniref:glucokinase n=1 Tax=Algirhabdus cladophorae TaxID=3377108 RepID=UPI003B847008
MEWDLVADIGGTNTRLARVHSGEILGTKTFPTKSDKTLVQLIHGFIEDQPTQPGRAVVAMAGPVRDGTVTLTNAQNPITGVFQSLAEDEVAQLTQSNRARIINDFEAAAWALATVQPQEVHGLQGDGVLKPGNRLIVGPGTGLGVGTLVKTAHGFQAVPGEGGHIGISPQSPEERQVFQAFGKIWPETMMRQPSARFEAEAMLSGTGLPRLYNAACDSIGQPCKIHDAEGVLAAAKLGLSNQARVTLEIFKRHLGQVIGDLAITNHASGGVFLAGGVATKNPWIFDDMFFETFNAGGRERFSQARSGLSVFLYQNDNFGLIGAANALAFGN